MNDEGLYPAKHQWRDSVQESLHCYAYPASEKGVLFGRKMEKEAEVVDLSWSGTLICWLGCRIAQRSCILKSENVHW